MKKISELFSGALLLILGAALLGGGVYFLKDKVEFFTQSIQTDGIVTDITSSGSLKKTVYYPIISFQAADGVTYSFASETGSSGAFDYNNGDKIKVRYIKEKPQAAKLDSFMELWGLPAALLLAGIVVFLAGGGTVYSHFNKIKLKKELPKTGRLIKLSGRVEMKSTKNKTEFVIISDWHNPVDNKMYAFTSDTLSFDPTTYIKDRMMDVWIAPESPKKKHYIDISFLPEMA